MATVTQPKNFFNAEDVARILDVSERTALRRIKQMNDEMLEQGYYAEAGKVPVQKFYEKYHYLKEGVSE